MLRQGRVHDHARSLKRVEEYPHRDWFTSAVLVRPDHFTVNYCINPYMVDDVNNDEARRQWVRLATVYDRLMDDVHILNPHRIWTERDESQESRSPEELPDIVYCSNHAVPGPRGERFHVANMEVEERSDEVVYFTKWAEKNGYETVQMESSVSFEGNGDAKWHPNRRLLWGGYGQRTERGAYDALASQMNVDIITLELTDEAYYHLDVCFSPLDEETVLICREAFTDRGLSKINQMWSRVIHAPVGEVQDGFACNCHSVDGENVVIEEGNEKTVQSLRDAGFTPIEVPTGEFIKGGGSISCLVLGFD